LRDQGGIDRIQPVERFAFALGLDVERTDGAGRAGNVQCINIEFGVQASRVVHYHGQLGGGGINDINIVELLEIVVIAGPQGLVLAAERNGLDRGVEVDQGGV